MISQNDNHSDKHPETITQLWRFTKAYEFAIGEKNAKKKYKEDEEENYHLSRKWWFAS